MADAVAEELIDQPSNTGLSRTIDLTRVSWMTLSWIVVFLIGSVLRLFQLGLATLSPIESVKAWEAWSLVYGGTEGVHSSIDKTAPTGLLLRSCAFFLFGDTDTTVRIPSAILGIGLIVLIWSIRDIMGEWRALAAGMLVAVSPTLMLASRTVNDEIIGLFFGTLLLITIFRFSQQDRTIGIGRAFILGGSFAALLGSGPTAITLLITMLITLAVSPFVSLDRGAMVRSAMERLRSSQQLMLTALVTFIIAGGILFTRFFSSPGAISGLGSLFADWGRMLTSDPGSISTQFFILALLVYEIVAVVFAIKVAFSAANAEEGRIFDWSFPAVWFLASLILFSFTSGRQPEQTVLIAFPLLLLGGFGLGDTLEKLFGTANRSNRLAWLVGLTAGLIITLIAVLILIGRVDSAINRNDAIVQVLAATILALAPLVVLTYSISEQQAGVLGWGSVRAAMFTGVAIVLGLFIIRSGINLNFYDVTSGKELLGQNTSVTDLREITRRTANLSRDVNGAERSPANPTGGKEMTIALDRTVQWPFRWYFRDFPNLTLTAPGAAPSLDAQMVIAPDLTGMSEAGYTPKLINVTANVAPNLLDPSMGTVLKYIFLPSNWDTGFRFLLYREGVTAPAPSTVTFGYSAPVTAQMTGERPTYGLYDRAGQGSNPGQFNEPRGVAVSQDGSRIYVLDTHNGRIQVFDDSGALITIWGDGDDGVQLEVTESGFGASGITVGPDGLVYVADTWSHRIIVIDADGQIVRTFGEFGDNADSTDPTLNPGMFYGPRDLVIYNNEVYVTDTGNERVQVFGLDGSFKRAFGGTGTAAGQLLEPVGITVGSDGNVYVADSHNGRISIFDINGTPITQWAVSTWQGAQFYEPYLTADAAGHIYYSDSSTASVLVYDLTGNVVDTIHTAGTNQLELPAGMAILDGTQLLIADRGASEIYDADITAIVGGVVPPVVELPDGNASPEASPQASPEASPGASPSAQ